LSATFMPTWLHRGFYPRDLNLRLLDFDKQLEMGKTSFLKQLKMDKIPSFLNVPEYSSAKDWGFLKTINSYVFWPFLPKSIYNAMFERLPYEARLDLFREQFKRFRLNPTKSNTDYKEFMKLFSSRWHNQ